MTRTFLACLIIFVTQLIYCSKCNQTDFQDIIDQSRRDAQGRIYAGKMTASLLPYQVLIYALIENKVILSRTCGGSLITVNYVLTAASCIDHAFLAQCVFGAHYSNQAEPTQVIMGATELKLHTNWVPEKFINDIGLIKLPAKIKLIDKVIGLVNLPTKSVKSPDYNGTVAKTSGWGITSDQPHSVHFFLKDLRVTVTSAEKCKVFNHLLPSTICGIGDYNGNPCEGDQGGPLVIEETNVQIGIASFGDRTCISKQPYIYTKVVDYLDWINLNSDIKL